MKKSKYAFTMIEMIFVIVVLGILSAIAIPRMAATRTDAEVTKGRADVASVRSGIVTERQTRLITGDSAYISGIDLNNVGSGVFGGVLMYPVTTNTGNGHWNKVGTDTNASSTLTYTVSGAVVTFTYTRSTGVFTCDTTAGTTAQQDMCKNLIN